MQKQLNKKHELISTKINYKKIEIHKMIKYQHKQCQQMKINKLIKVIKRKKILFKNSLNKKN